MKHYFTIEAHQDGTPAIEGVIACAIHLSPLAHKEKDLFRFTFECLDRERGIIAHRRYIQTVPELRCLLTTIGAGAKYEVFAGDFPGAIIKRV